MVVDSPHRKHAGGWAIIWALAMETLQDESADNLGGWTIAALVSLPHMALFVAVYTLAYHVTEEPFGRLNVQDASVMLGGLFLIVALWLCWGWMVWRHKVRAVIWVPLAFWAPISVWLGADNLLGYFQQPWHNWKPLF